jgi:energy-coupling factor transport system substrate-specific component
MSRKNKIWVYPLICSAHGFLFGIMYSPAQAIIFGLSFKQTLAWIVAGLGFDFIHGIGNLAVGLLILPLYDLLLKIAKKEK